MAITRPCQGRNEGSIPFISSNARSFVIIEPLKSIDSKDLAMKKPIVCLSSQRPNYFMINDLKLLFLKMIDNALIWDFRKTPNVIIRL